MLPKIAVISFPGTNCEVESVRAMKRNGMEALSMRWNAVPRSDAVASTIGGYFLPGGFSYEDRGRSGMIAAHDPLMDFLRGESAKGKVIIGHCNGAQILVESGLIPLDRGLRMALAKNILCRTSTTLSVTQRGIVEGLGVTPFLNRWVYIKRTCARDQCAVSDWDGTMHVPIAHGEGRFTTRDQDVLKELQKNDQIAFQYCDAEGNVSAKYPITPNGSMFAIAGICNPAGNIIALMPHPERTTNGDPYFLSMRRWMERGEYKVKKVCHSEPFDNTSLCHTERSRSATQSERAQDRLRRGATHVPYFDYAQYDTELFIDTVITNNEERSLEQLLKRYLPQIKLKQYRYIRCKNPKEFLSHISNYNPNKERAHIGRQSLDLKDSMCVSRFDDGAEEGVCYVCKGIREADVEKQEIREIFGNPHASTISRLH